MSLRSQISDLYESRGIRPYDLEGLSQLDHAVQAAALAEQAGHPAAMVLAALLHDIGHLIQPFGDNPAADGIDHAHERLGAAWLSQYFPPEVYEPVRWHVEAKRYLCATREGYASRLAPDSIQSLKVQGGPMSDAEARAFEVNPHHRQAVQLRYIDDAAKLLDARPPPLSHFLQLADHVADRNQPFAETGVLVLREFFTQKEFDEIAVISEELGGEAASLLRRARDQGRDPAEMAQEDREGLIVVPEADAPLQVCRFEYLLGRSPCLSKLAASSIAPLIYAITGESFLPFKDKENEKRPGGGAFRPHQDYEAYKAFGPSYNATAMIALDPATRANGCLEFAGNAVEVARAREDLVAEWVDDRPLFRAYAGGPKNGDMIDEAVRALEWEAVEVAPRDLVLFDSFVPHRSAVNGTGMSRRAIFLTYAPEREGDWYDRYYAEKRARFHDPKFHVSTPTV